MPYFKWQGVNLHGVIKKGRLSALSENHLDAILLKKDIAMLSCASISPFFIGPILLSHKIQFFRQLSTLLDSGLLVHDALQIMGQYVCHIRLQEIIFHIGEEVGQGTSFSQALNKHPHVFDDAIVQMVYAGERSGAIGQVAAEIAHYLEMKNQFHTQMRAGALMPCITFVFFLVVMLIIFIGVIPRLIDILVVNGKQLPALTQAMLTISNFLKSGGVLLLPMVVGLGYFLTKILRNNKNIILWTDFFIISLPLIGTLVKKKNISYFTHTLSLLLSSGIQLVPALDVAKKVVQNSKLYYSMVLLESEIQSGSTLSEAMIQQQQWFDQGAIAMIKVGEESGALKDMLMRVARMHEEQVKESLSLVVKVFQPCLIVGMGLLVAILLFSVYVPIFNMPEVVAFLIDVLAVLQ